jgi:hypothetical protein
MTAVVVGFHNSTWIRGIGMEGVEMRADVFNWTKVLD